VVSCIKLSLITKHNADNPVEGSKRDMAMPDRDSRFRWQEGKEAELWAYMEKKIQDGVSITAALKEYGDRNGMSWLTARWKYYQLRKRKAEQEMAPTRQEPQDHGDFIAHLANFVSMSREAGEDVVPLVRGLSRLAMLSCQGLRAREQALREAQEIRVLQAKTREAFSRLQRFLEDWLNQPQVDQVGSLKDFSTRLRKELDEIKGLAAQDY
jgi:hypothetical protein